MNSKNLENHAKEKLVIARQRLQKEYKNHQEEKITRAVFVSRFYTVVIHKVLSADNADLHSSIHSFNAFI